MQRKKKSFGFACARVGGAVLLLLVAAVCTYVCVCYVRKSSCFSDRVVDTRKKSLSSGLGLVEGTGTCNRDWMIPLFHSVFNFSVTFSRVVFPSDGEWWLRLLPTSHHRRPSVPAPWHERRASFVGRDLVNRQPLPVQPIAIARAILVPS